jgi:hypothetical protein
MGIVLEAPFIAEDDRTTEPDASVPRRRPGEAREVASAATKWD